jgi:hypothetical protein
MKKLILFLFIVAMSRGFAFPQGCLPEGIIFETQEQIDNFQIYYPGCTEIEGDVFIGSENGNYDIMNLQGLIAVKNIDGCLEINGCHGLGILSGLDSLTWIGGYLRIQNCTELDNFSGLNSLTHVGGAFEITGNYMLTSIQALESLTAIDSGFVVADNPSLHTLEGLDHLIYIAGSIKIMSNAYLADIGALKNILADSIQTYVAMMNNTNLSNCAIQSICDYLEIPDGLAIFNNNAPGCNSKTEVQQACLTSVEENINNDEITLFPNPASSLITLTSPGDLPAAEVIIYNHIGQKVLTAKPMNNTVDVSGLRAGMYMIQVKTKDFTGRQKMIKN